MATSSLRHGIPILTGVILVAVLAGCTPTFNWAIKAGSNFWEEGHSVATDTSGNVYVTGNFTNTVDFDPGPGVVNLSTWNQAAFVAKYSPTGALAWARKLPSTGAGGQGIAVDTNANVYVIGYFQSNQDFDPGPGTSYLTSGNGWDAFILKLNSAGGFVWAKGFGAAGSGTEYPRSVAVNSGFVYVTGGFNSTADFDPGAGVFNLTATSSSKDVFVLKLNAVSGSFVWAKRFGGSGSYEGEGIAADAGGGVYVTGTFTNTITLGSFTLTSAGNIDGFVAKLNGAGAVVFAGRIGGTSGAQPTGIAVDQSGNMVVVGTFRGTADFDPGTATFNLVAGANDRAFVLKLNPAGSFVWAKGLGTPGFNTQAKGVAVDASGNIHATGSFTGTTDFNPGTATYNITSAGSTDAFIWKLDPSGAYSWAGRLGGTASDYGLSIAVNGCSGLPTQVNITGIMDGTGDYDPTTGISNLTSAGNGDMLTAQITYPATTIAQHLYVSSQGRILRYPAGGPPLPPPTVFVPLGSGGASQPTGLTFGPDCNLYASNFSANQVMRYNGSTGAPLSSAGNAGAVFVTSQSGGLVTPHGLTFGADGKLYVSSIGTTSDVLRYDGVAGTFDANFTGVNPPVYARGITFGGPAGDLYVTGDHNVLRFNRTTGALDTSWNLAADPIARTHYDLTFGPGSDLYVTAFETNKVLRFNGTTGAPLPDFVPAGSGGLTRPIGLAFGPDGNLYVSSAVTNQILRYNGTTGTFIDVFASGGGLTAPGYLVFGP